MKVQVIYTLQELQKITPSLTKEHLISDKPHIKEILKEYFWRLGCTIPDKFEIEEGRFKIMVGSSSDNTPLEQEIEINK